jgi:hypothetical protein
MALDHRDVSKRPVENVPEPPPTRNSLIREAKSSPAGGESTVTHGGGLDDGSQKVTLPTRSAQDVSIPAFSAAGSCLRRSRL